ncbi:MAG: hypothetical protein PHX83_00650 [Acidobacteriia bacterium]|nr:hypothetical protein [Terriglobia bacterium]
MTLRKAFLVIGAFLILIPFASWAQETPQAEVFGGYSYIRTGTSSLNFNGFSSSVAGNVNNWLGVVADVGYYRSKVAGVSVNAVSYTFGPRFSYRSDAKVTPFFQTLFGGVRLSGGGVSDNAFAMTAGGGVDVNVSPAVAIRLAQAEYLMTRSSGTTENNFRFSAGVVFRIGKK